MALVLVNTFRNKKNNNILKVYETPKGNYRGKLLDASKNIISSSMFYVEDKEASEYRVREYYNFLGDDIETL